MSRLIRSITSIKQWALERHYVRKLVLILIALFAVFVLINASAGQRNGAKQYQEASLQS